MAKNGQKQAKWTQGLELLIEERYEKSEYLFEISEVQASEKYKFKYA